MSISFLRPFLFWKMLENVSIGRKLEKIKWRHNCKGFSLPPPLSLIHAHIQHEHSLEINSYFEHFTTVTDIHGLMQLYSLRTFLCSDSDWNVFSEVTSRVRNPKSFSIDTRFITQTKTDEDCDFPLYTFLLVQLALVALLQFAMYVIFYWISHSRLFNKIDIKPTYMYKYSSSLSLVPHSLSHMLIQVISHTYVTLETQSDY